MNASQDEPTMRERLVAAGTELFRQDGYTATSVQDICARAGVTKGAFFHHFTSKEDLGVACLEAWKAFIGGMEAAAPFAALSDPVERLLGCMDFYIELLAGPGLKSCLAGTTVQEVAHSSAPLRDAANDCFVTGAAGFQARLEQAFRAVGREREAGSLASLWIATVQGALILCKASNDTTVIRTSLMHVRTYIADQLKDQHDAATSPRRPS